MGVYFFIIAASGKPGIDASAEFNMVLGLILGMIFFIVGGVLIIIALVFMLSVKRNNERRKEIA